MLTNLEPLDAPLEKYVPRRQVFGGCVASADHHFLRVNQACSPRALLRAFMLILPALLWRPVLTHGMLKMMQSWQPKNMWGALSNR
eukprot:404472-Pelagomonas_calceolata.AAC.1